MSTLPTELGDPGAFVIPSYRGSAASPHPGGRRRQNGTYPVGRPRAAAPPAPSRPPGHGLPTNGEQRGAVGPRRAGRAGARGSVCLLQGQVFPAERLHAPPAAVAAAHHTTTARGTGGGVVRRERKRGGGCPGAARAPPLEEPHAPPQPRHLPREREWYVIATQRAAAPRMPDALCCLLGPATSVLGVRRGVLAGVIGPGATLPAQQHKDT